MSSALLRDGRRLLFQSPRFAVASLHYVQRIWALGMSSQHPGTVRDTAIVTFAFCMNGLRESSVASLLTANLALAPDSIVARLSLVKGRSASGVPLVRFDRLNDLPSPIDLWHRWDSVRGSHLRYFALPGEPSAWRTTMLTEALRRCLTSLDLAPPPHGKFTFHSLRIGAHTEQILLGIPLEVRLGRFGWGVRSQEMAALYFDRTIRTTAASFWFFGPAFAAATADPVSTGQ